MKKYKVSVVVPIYNVEKFIERCVRSLMEQTLTDIEYIFVDDASPDNSIAVLERCLADYPQRKDDVKLLVHEVNKGLPSARNTGLNAASGDYIFHCDSDDFVERDMLECMYGAALLESADLVWSDFYLSFGQNERYMSQKLSPDTSAFLKQGMLGGAIKYNVWNKLVRRELYSRNDIHFPDGHSMGEDMTMIRLAACSRKNAYVPMAFYHYVQLNANAFSRNFSEKYLNDIKCNADLTLSFLLEKYPEKLSSEMAFFKLNLKLPFLISDNPEHYRIWKQWYPEAGRYIMANKVQAFRTRFVQWMAFHNQFWLVKLYYSCIIKLVYGIIYK